LKIRRVAMFVITSQAVLNLCSSPFIEVVVIIIIIIIIIIITIIIIVIIVW